MGNIRLKKLLKENVPSKKIESHSSEHGLASDIIDSWVDIDTIKDDLVKFMKAYYETGGPEVVKDAMNAINSAMNDCRKYLK